MKKWFIIGSLIVTMLMAILLVVVAPLLVAIAPVSGAISFTEMILSRFDDGSEEKANQLWMDIDNEQVRKAIEETDAEEFDKELFSKENILKYIEYEDGTYSRDHYSYMKKTIRKTKAADEDKYDIKVIEKTSNQIDFRELEYNYRLPWQTLAVSDLLNNDEEITLEMIEKLKPIYSYYYPNKDIARVEFTNSYTGINLKKLFDEERPGGKIDNRKIIQNESLSVYYEGKPYSSYEETKRVSKHKYYKRNEDGSYSYKETEETERIDLVLTDPLPSLVNVKTPYKNVDFLYQKDFIEKVLSANTHTEYEYDGEGERIGKVVIKETTYYKEESIELDQTEQSDLETGFDEFAALMEFEETNSDLFVDLVSLLPGGFFVAKDMVNVQSENKKLSILSSLMNTGSIMFFGNIEIMPSELALPIPRFYQNDSRWANLPFGHTTMARGACGPTSAAMVLTGINREVYNPFDIATIAAANGYQTNVGTKWSFFKYIGNREGIEVKQLGSHQVNEMLAELAKGNPVIASMKPGHFTKRGHFIVLTHIDEKGYIVVNDPSDRLNIKNRPWIPYIVIDEAKQYWVFENNNEELLVKGVEEDQNN